MFYQPYAKFTGERGHRDINRRKYEGGYAEQERTKWQERKYQERRKQRQESIKLIRDVE